MTCNNKEREIASFAVGKKYTGRYPEAPAAPWLDSLPSWRTCLSSNTWKRWDGTVATAQEHMYWMREQAKALFDDQNDEFRPYGKHRGCTYYIHDGLTQAGDGYGCFKIHGPVLANVQPRDVLRLCFDMPQIIELDPTCVFYKLMKAYPLTLGDKTSYVHPVYWCNDPGFPFYYRNGIDLTGFMPDTDDEVKDDDNEKYVGNKGDASDSSVIWQLGVGVTLDDWVTPPGTVKATDRYWAYRLSPTPDGTGTQVSILCQCCLNGWIPKILSNYFVCQVLIDSLARMERQVHKWKIDEEAKQQHEIRLQQLQLM